VQLARQVRACDPWPVAETLLDGERLRCWAAVAVPATATDTEAAAAAPPGRVLAAGPAGIDVQTGAGVLRLTAVQLPGRQRVAAADFARGHGIVGKQLGGAP
jgi:methionyl-tRNA formyltransferase